MMNSKKELTNGGVERLQKNDKKGQELKTERKGTLAWSVGDM